MTELHVTLEMIAVLKWYDDVALLASGDWEGAMHFHPMRNVPAAQLHSHCWAARITPQI